MVDIYDVTNGHQIGNSLLPDLHRSASFTRTTAVLALSWLSMTSPMTYAYRAHAKIYFLGVVQLSLTEISETEFFLEII